MVSAFTVLVLQRLVEMEMQSMHDPATSQISIPAAGWPYLLHSFGSVASMGTGVTQ